MMDASNIYLNKLQFFHMIHRSVYKTVNFIYYCTRETKYYYYHYRVFSFVLLCFVASELMREHDHINYIYTTPKIDFSKNIMHVQMNIVNKFGILSRATAF